MNRDDAMKAVDEAFADGVKHLYSIFVAGLVASEAPAVLADRFRNGLAFNCDAHAKTMAIVSDYFQGFKS